METISQELKNEIRNHLEESLGTATFSDEDSLVLSGRLSSLQVVNLAAKLEEKYNLDFAANGFNQYDFDSVNSILQLIESANEENIKE